MDKWIIVNKETGKRATTKTFESKEEAEAAKGSLLTESGSDKPALLEVRQLLTEG